ncbi:conjugative transposon protein TraJ [Longitalea luteola]|uniref:conjugative transposon protein TraJ n=1 Tax=Longitalea luteola TaxID=2812563 RepID=UPI001A963D91|nr:conjugative transposon protein TraJ [Longitalea luteola]
MNRTTQQALLCLAVVLMTPALTFAQGGMAGEIKNLHQVLAELYTEMYPLCKELRDVGRGIAGFAATWYIAYRVWGHIARAEPIDFYPLLRPFVIGFAILNFQLVIEMIRFVMEPTVTGTGAMVDNSNQAVAQLLKMKEEAIKKTKAWKMYVGESGSGDYDQWYKYNFPDDDQNWLQDIGNRISFFSEKAMYSFRNSIKEWLSIVLQILFQAAALCINTIRTFYMIVLAILGPLVFGLSVFDGFQHTLRAWLARYINIFMWLPVANIFGAIIGKIQENMLKIDIQQVYQNGDTSFSATDAAYLVFMVIGIVGYFTVPTVANYIIQAGGGGNALGNKTVAAGHAMHSMGTALERRLSGK